MTVPKSNKAVAVLGATTCGNVRTLALPTPSFAALHKADTTSKAEDTPTAM